MSLEFQISEITLLRGIGFTSKARIAHKNGKAAAKPLLHEGLRLIFKALEMDLDNISNRIMVLKHLIGITKESPVKLNSEIEDIISFLDKNFQNIESDEVAYYLGSACEYYAFTGNIVLASDYLKKVMDIAPESTPARVARLTLEKYVYNY